MKKLLLVGLVLGLTVLISSSALGAIHDAVNGEFEYFYRGGGSAANNTNFSYMIVDSWYSITPKPKYVLFSGIASEGVTPGFYPQVNAKLYTNEQTFAEIWGGNNDKTSFKGTILTEPGFFLGMDYFVDNLGEGSTMITPGFRYDFGKNWFIALSIDSDVEDGDFYAIDLDYKYINDKIKLFSQLYNIESATSSTLEGGYYDIGCYYKILPQLVIGAKLGSHADEYAHHHIGLTWKPANLIVDFKYETDEQAPEDINNVYASCMVNLDKNISLGLQVDNRSGWALGDIDHVIYYLKAKYNTNCGTFKLVYTPEFFNNESLLNLQYQIAL